MTRLRSELVDAHLKTPCMRNGTAYMLILAAVDRQNGLIHGKLDDRGEHCAIGSYFDQYPKTALPSDLIDEVAAVNDAVPHLTKPQRKRYVARWLRWKLTQLGMPGFRTKTAGRAGVK